MTEQPATRYRVIERDRRLVVIDTWAEEGRPASVSLSPISAARPAASDDFEPDDVDGAYSEPDDTPETDQESDTLRWIHQTIDDAPPSQAGSSHRVKSERHGILTTHRSFDDKGPRKMRSIRNRQSWPRSAGRSRSPSSRRS